MEAEEMSLLAIVGGLLGYKTAQEVDKIIGEKKRRATVERRTTLPDMPCDICEGTGEMETYSPPAYYTTASYTEEQYAAIQKDLDENHTVVTVPCGTCNGTKILPKHLIPGYWVYD